MKEQTHYYLIEGKIMKGDVMPNDESMFYKRKDDTQNWGDFLHKEWLNSLRPCQISPTDLEQIKSYYQMTILRNEPIDCSEVVSDNDGVVTFIEVDKNEPHTCKYCGAETTQSDNECYAKPKSEANEAVESQDVLWDSLIDEWNNASLSLSESHILPYLKNKFTITRNNK